MPGDNLVWQVESLDDFAPFATAFCQAALARARKLVYFRFADHEPLVPDSLAVDDPPASRRRGVRAVRHRGPSRDSRGRAGGTCFVFDCLSSLVDFWHTDRMLGNFFMLACPASSNADRWPIFR